MKRPLTHSKHGLSIIPVIRPVYADGDPEGGAGGGGAGGEGGSGDGGAGDKGSDKSDKKYTDADVNKIAARHKSEGKAAAEKALVDALGCTIEEAKAIIAKNREAEDAKKSEAEREREKAAAERTEAEKAREDAKQEVHTARIERALAKLGFTGEDADLARVTRMVTAEVGSSYDDVLKDVTELKKTLNPELFSNKSDGKGKPGGRLPAGDPKGKAPAPAGGEDAYSAGQKRFEERAASRRRYDPTAKTA